jgi:hypothetical protein
MFEGLFSSEAAFARSFTAIAHRGAGAASLVRDARARDAVRFPD